MQTIVNEQYDSNFESNRQYSIYKHEKLISFIIILKMSNEQEDLRMLEELNLSQFSQYANETQPLKLALSNLSQQNGQNKILISKIRQILNSQKSQTNQLKQIQFLFANIQSQFDGPKYPKKQKKTEHQTFVQAQLRKQLKMVEWLQLQKLQLQRKYDQVFTQKLQLMKQVNMNQKIEDQVKKSEEFYKQQIERINHKKKEEKQNLQNMLRRIFEHDKRQLTKKLKLQFDETIQANQKELKKMKAQLLQKEQEVAKINEDKGRLVTQNNQLKNSHSILQNQVVQAKELADRCDILQKKITQKNEQNNELILSNQQLSKNNQIMHKDIDGLNQRIDKIKKQQNAEKNKINENAKKRQNDLMKQIQQIKNDNQIQIIKQENEKNIIQLKEQHQKQLKEIKDNQFKKYQQKIEMEKEKIKNLSKESQNTIQHLNSQLLKQKSQKQALAKEKQILENNLIKISNQLKTLKQQNSKISKDNQFDNQYQKLKIDRDNLSQANATKQQQINRLTIQNKSQMAVLMKVTESYRNSSKNITELKIQLLNVDKINKKKENERLKKTKAVQAEFLKKQGEYKHYIQVLENQKQQIQSNGQQINKNTGIKQNNQQFIDLQKQNQQLSKKAAKYKSYYFYTQTNQGIFKSIQKYTKKNTRQQIREFAQKLLIQYNLLINQ